MNSSNNNKKCVSFLTFKEYCLSFIYKESQLIDGWGWFVDIEENKEKILSAVSKNHNHKQVKHSLSIPTTIQERSYIQSRLRSRQSISNLQEYSHEYYDSKVDNRFHIICIFGVLCVFWFSIN
jgi:hypothetical protein